MSSPVQLRIIGMSCAGCVATVEAALGKVAGVSRASVNFAEQSASVEGDAASADLIKAVQDAGYDAADASEDRQGEAADKSNTQLTKAAVAASFGAPLMVLGHLAMLPKVAGNLGFWLAVGLGTLGILYYAGGAIFASAVKLLAKRRANMDTLLALGTGSAWLYSMMIVIFGEALTPPDMEAHTYFEAAVIILAFVNLGSALESRARHKTAFAIRHLIGLQPRTAIVVQNGDEKTIPIAEVTLGDTVRVRPGEKIPIDGVVLEGYSTIDEALLSGEPSPVEKGEGAQVVAGSINQQGSFLLQVTAVGANTTLAQIIASVRGAGASKPAIAKLADQIASVFTPVVLAIAVATFLLWLALGPTPAWSYGFAAAMTVLVIACPCALGLATPISVTVAVGRAAEIGVLVRQGARLQTAAKLTHLLLDKTGTITLGKPALTNIISLNGQDSEQLLRVAASIEAQSEHPLAATVVAASRAKNLQLHPISSFVSLTGLGVSATINKQSVHFGNLALMESIGSDWTAHQELIAKFSAKGQTVMLLAQGLQPSAIITVTDPIKPDAAAAIGQLQHQGIHIIMATGDNEPTARAVARQVGIEEVEAGVLPADKAALVAKLQAAGGVVGMVGDGINDAPALAGADASFAIGSGADVAIESADFVILQGSLLKVALTRSLAQATISNIKQNLGAAFFFNTVGIPIAAGALYPAFGILLSPIVAGAAMAMSSVCVVSNANRLRWIRLG